jgi:hypothetical protein
MAPSKAVLAGKADDAHASDEVFSGEGGDVASEALQSPLEQSKAAAAEPSVSTPEPAAEPASEEPPEPAAEEPASTPEVAAEAPSEAPEPTAADDGTAAAGSTVS